MNSFYSLDELKKLGFKKIGNNVNISRKASIYGSDRISIGNNVRIDDFCLLSGTIEIGNNVHIAAYASLFAGNTGIVLKDFVGISSRSVIYAESDDYSGEYLTNPTVPIDYKNIQCGKVIFEKHSLLGTGCTVLPNVIVGEGASIGAMSLINKNIEPWTINVGVPAKKIKTRSQELLSLEQLYNKRIEDEC